MAGNKRADDKMLRFRNDLLWTGLGGNNLPRAKIFSKKNNCAK